MNKYKFCPYCGSSFKKYKEYYQCPSCGKKVYLSSYPTASAFIVKNGKYLISKRGIEPSKGMYDIVGGFLKEGETPEKGLIREFKEETGSSVKIIDLLGIYLGKYKIQGEISTTFNLCYIAKLTNPKIDPRDDVASFHWFPINKVPKNLSDPWLAKALKDLQIWYAKQQKIKTNH